MHSARCGSTPHTEPPYPDRQVRRSPELLPHSIFLQHPLDQSLDDVVAHHLAGVMPAGERNSNVRAHRSEAQLRHDAALAALAQRLDQQARLAGVAGEEAFEVGLRVGDREGETNLLGIPRDAAGERNVPVHRLSPQPSPGSTLVVAHRRAQRAEYLRTGELHVDATPGGPADAEVEVEPVAFRVAKVLVHADGVTVDAVDDDVAPGKAGIHVESAAR